MNKTQSYSNNKYNFAACAIVITLICFLLATLPAYAQPATSELSGTISDPAGAKVPNAAVEVKSRETGKIFKTVSGDQGRFTFANLPPGEYEIKVSAKGFKQFSRKE